MIEKIVHLSQSQFLQERDATDFSLLRNIPSLINKVENYLLCKQPSIEEVMKVVLNLNEDYEWA